MTIVAADRAKIKNYFDEAIQTMSDVDDLREALKDLTKVTAESMDIKPAALSKALKVAYKQIKGKGSFDDEQDELNLIEQLLVAAGRVNTDETLAA